jgi:hypothetical protein
MINNKNRFWLGWTLANGLAELACLEATYAAIDFITNTSLTAHISGLQMYAVIALISAVIEATTVGLAQAWLMRVTIPTIRRITWWGATLLGTLLAYALGWWPLNRVLDWLDNPPHTLAYFHEPSTLEVLLLVIGAGAAIGASLSFFQWLLLRRQVPRAGQWIAKNVEAWACGFPLLLLALALILANNFQPTWLVRLALVEAILVVGLLVGAINGRYLAHLAGDTTPSRFIRSIQNRLNALWLRMRNE